MARRPGFRIEAEGLKEFARDMRDTAPELPRALAKELKGVSEFARDMVAHEAARLGYNDTGDLIAGLKAGSTRTTGFVRDTARHGGYPYPARLEYEDGGAHAFARPAIEAGQSAIRDKLVDAIDRVVDQANH